MTDATSPIRQFQYDDAGNMTQGYTPDGYVFTAQYDAENRLKILEYIDGTAIMHKTEYIYNGYGFLAQIKKYENFGLVDETRIIRSGFLAMQERDAANTIQKEYTWGLNMGGGIGGLLNLSQGGNKYDYLYDGKGNVTALIDSAQALAATYRYDAFGTLMAKTGTLAQPFMFSTKRYDTQTGLSYFGYRFYNPSIGKWLTRDPIGEAGGINLYSMVQNDPVNLIDPWGLEGLVEEMPMGDFKDHTFKPSAGVSYGVMSYDVAYIDGALAASSGIQTPEVGVGVSFSFVTKDIDPSGTLYKGGIGYKRLGFSTVINISSSGIELVEVSGNIGVSIGIFPFHLSVPEQGPPCDDDDPYLEPMF